MISFGVFITYFNKIKIKYMAYSYTLKDFLVTVGQGESDLEAAR